MKQDLDRQPLSRPIRVDGISRLYTVVSRPALLDGQLNLSFTPGVSVYSFTFG